MDKGRSFGTYIPGFKKGCYSISSRVGLLAGSKFKILVIRPLALSDMGTCSGNE